MDSVSRKQVYDWLHRCLIGPANANVDSLNGICPLERFQSGILFPISVGEFGADPADEDSDDDDDAPDDGDKAGAEAAGLSRPKRRVVPPSSVGFSFFVCGDRIEIELIPRAVCYQCGEERNERGEWKSETWSRVPLGGDNEAPTLEKPVTPAVHRWRVVERSG